MKREPDGEVAMFIELTNLCQALHCLPEPGGLLNQDAYLVDGMSAVLVAQTEKTELEMKKSDADIRKAKH